VLLVIALLLLAALGLALLGVVVVIGGAMAEERRRGDGRMSSQPTPERLRRAAPREAWPLLGCPLRGQATDRP
jgi:hypothetical protein